MSSSTIAINKIASVLNKLDFEPVMDSDSSVKEWIASHNGGFLTPFVNGSFVSTSDEQKKLSFTVKNPFSGQTLANVVECDKNTLNAAIEAANAAQAEWREMGTLKRGRVIYNIARNVQKYIQLLAMCESVNSARSSREVKELDIASIIKTLYYYAGASGLEGADDDDYTSLGVVAIVGYYDSALLSLVAKLVPALAAGNSCLVVPHKLTPLSAFLFVEICVQSGIPPGVVNLLTSDKEDLLKWIAEDKRVNGIFFDGRYQRVRDSVLAYSFVHPSKRVHWSVEGKSSLVVYDSADIDSVIETIVDGCFYSNGQHRYSLNKLFVQENISDDVSQRLEARFAKLRVGNNSDKCNDFSALLNSEDRSACRQALSQQATEHGAQVLDLIKFKTTIQDAKSDQLIAPIIVKNVSINSQLNLDEVNGPYVMVIPFRTVKESVELVNCSRLAGGVSLHSQNISLVMEVAYLLNVGTVWINGFPIARGVQTRKQSGKFAISGPRSLTSFMRPKWEPVDQATEKGVDLSQAMSKFKLFGAASVQPTLPSALKMSTEKTYKLYIGGKQVRPNTQSSRNVMLGNDLYCVLADASRQDVRNAVEAAHSAATSWWKRANHNKAQILYFFGENLQSRQSEFVAKLELFTRKSKTECEREFKMCLEIIFYFASQCDKQIGSLNDTSEYGYMMEAQDPIGTVAIVCNYNSEDQTPLFTFIAHMVGAIAYGNSVIMITDERSAIPCVDLYEVLETSDMPDGVVNIFTGDKHHLAKYLCEHQQLSALWYMSDIEGSTSKASTSARELEAKRFLTYTSAFSQKQLWFIDQIPLVNDFPKKSYLNELRQHATQSKYINIPMGTIFAN